MVLKRFLHLHDILHWADAYRETTGKWPTKSSGIIPGTVGETWDGVDRALRDGLRGLPGSSSLAQFLTRERGARNIHKLSAFTEEQVLAWADAHHQRTGSWPTRHSGIIPDSGMEKWAAVDTALRAGKRGLPGGSSLARFLDEHRGVRNRKGLPPLPEEQILAWADAHHGRTGTWPAAKSGPIPEAPGETWLAADMALRLGRRGLPGGSSLAALLAGGRGVRNVWSRPTLSVEQVVAWADAYHAQTGEWPHIESGPIREAPGETWCAVNQALSRGLRGLPGDSSLAKLLYRERGVRSQSTVPRLSRRQILAWADAHHRRTGEWPGRDSGAVAEAPGETWQILDAALHAGNRGLRGGSSLVRLLARHRQRPNCLDLPRLSRKKILAWADAHYERTGRWPNVNSGPVVDAPGEKWDLLDSALREGVRGMIGGSSLARLLARKRGLRNPAELPPLTEQLILDWADLHCRRTGSWPRYNDGRVADAPGETWGGLNYALGKGRRGLPRGSSLAKLLRARRAGSPAGSAGTSEG